MTEGHELLDAVTFTVAQAEAVMERLARANRERDDAIRAALASYGVREVARAAGLSATTVMRIRDRGQTPT